MIVQSLMRALMVEHVAKVIEAASDQRFLLITPFTETEWRVERPELSYLRRYELNWGLETASLA